MSRDRSFRIIDRSRTCLSSNSVAASQATHPSSRSLSVLLGLGGLAALAVLLRRRPWSLSRQAAGGGATPPCLEVTVAAVIHRPLREWQEFSGRLQAVNTVEVRPRVSGYVDRVAFEDGARVKKGQLLFQIDPRPFQAEVERLVAERSRSVSDLELAKANRARAERLISAHAISREEIRAAGGGRSLGAGSLGFDRCFAAGGAPESRSSRKCARRSTVTYRAPSSPPATSSRARAS